MTATSDSSSRLLPALAWLQAFAIVALMVVWLRTGDGAAATPPFEPAAESGASAAPAAAAAQHGGSPDTTEPSSGPAAAAMPAADEPSRPGPVDAAAGSAGPAALPPSLPASPVGTVVYGAIQGKNGEVIADGWVSFTIDGKRIAQVNPSSGTASYAIGGVPVGVLEFRARVPGFEELSGTIEVPAGVARLRHDIVLGKSWILTVKILTPEGEPLHVALREASKQDRMLYHVEVAAVVTATQPAGDFPPTPYREVRGGLGRWRGATGIEARMRQGAAQPKDVAGVIEIDDERPLWVSAVMRHRVLASMSVEPGQEEVVLTVPLPQVLGDLGTIRGRVVDAVTHEPVAGANVGFGDLQSSGSGGKAGDDGRFEVTHLRPGLLDVEIRAQRKSARRDLILLQPGQVLELGDVPVYEYRTIAGRCEGLTGEAESCRIAYTPLDPSWHPSVQRHTDSARVGSDGTFKLYLPDGRYRLRASGAGGAVVELDTVALGDQPLVLRLQPEAEFRIDVRTGGETWELAVFDAGNREVYRRQLRDGTKFGLPFLLGDYRIELTDQAGKVHERRVELGSDGLDLPVGSR